MTILSNIRDVRRKIEDEKEASGNGTSDTANRLKRKGLDAILRRPGAVESYMQEFAKTPDELARLMPTDEVSAKNDARAYLISNAPCTPETVSRLEAGVTALLDQP